jgi:hypothetical protein
MTENTAKMNEMGEDKYTFILDVLGGRGGGGYKASLC